MAANILTNETVRVQVTFRNWDAAGGEPIDPTVVTVDVLNGDLQRTAETEEAVRAATGIYYYDWTPTASGTFYVEFTGAYADGNTSVVREEFNVTDVPEDDSDDLVTLGVDYELTFYTDLDPLYLDPEDLMGIYPDATRGEVVEAVYRVSREVRDIFRGIDPPLRALEYIRAAALCSLARVHDATMNGMESSWQLGDLRAQSGTESISGGPKVAPAHYCDEALALRRELLRSRRGMKAVVRGGANPQVMPLRTIRAHEVQR